MSDPLKICIQRAETREQWDAMQDDYINRALAAADRIEKLVTQLKQRDSYLVSKDLWCDFVWSITND